MSAQIPVKQAEVLKKEEQFKSWDILLIGPNGKNKSIRLSSKKIRAALVFFGFFVSFFILAIVSWITSRTLLEVEREKNLLHKMDKISLRFELDQLSSKQSLDDSDVVASIYKKYILWPKLRQANKDFSLKLKKAKVSNEKNLDLDFILNQEKSLGKNQKIGWIFATQSSKGIDVHPPVFKAGQSSAIDFALAWPLKTSKKELRVQKKISKIDTSREALGQLLIINNRSEILASFNVKLSSDNADLPEGGN